MVDYKILRKYGLKLKKNRSWESEKYIEASGLVKELRYMK